MCSVNTYGRAHPSGTDNEISGIVKPLASKLSTDELESLGHTIKSVNNWLQYFIEN